LSSRLGKYKVNAKGKSSGYGIINEYLNLKPYSTISCKVTVTHEENAHAVGFVET